MKQRGFTLIELLAVIVVLAIIAIIAIPIIINVIDTAEKGAIKDSVYGIEEAASVYYAEHYTEGIAGKYNLDNTTIPYKGKIDRGFVYYGEKGKTTILIYNGKYCGYKYQNDEPEIGTVENDKCIIDEKEVDEDNLIKIEDILLPTNSNVRLTVNYTITLLTATYGAVSNVKGTYTIDVIDGVVTKSGASAVQSGAHMNNGSGNYRASYTVNSITMEEL